MELIQRPLYSERVKPFIGKGLIKVLTGQRRVGKSCILQQLMLDIQEEDPEAHIIYINKEKTKFQELKDETSFAAYVEQELVRGKNNYLFVDEIQEIDGFEHVLRSLQADDECDIFCTGSNARMLSGELATFLSGRYIEFHIYSLTYGEFLRFHGLKDEDASLMLYLTYGGMPYLIRLPLTEEMVSEYLRNIYATILLKDVVKREGVRNVSFLEGLSVFVADNVGSLFSANSISKYLKSQNTDISAPVILSYLRAMGNAFIINKVQRYDISGKKRFELNEKYYFEDIGLRNCLTGINLNKDINKLIENAIFLHLKAYHYEVYVGKIEDKEIDFIARKNGRVVYIQAAYLLADDETKKREFGNLMLIADNYPKYVVSMDPFNTGSDYGGIQHIHLRYFLRMEKY